MITSSSLAPISRSAKRITRPHLIADLPISIKVAAAPAFVLLAMLIMAAATLLFLQASERSVRELNEIAFERYRLASNLYDATQNAHRLLLKTLSIAANEADQFRLTESLRASYAADDTIADELAKLEGQFQNEDLVSQIRPLLDSYRIAANEVLDAARSDAASATLLTFAADRGADNLLALLARLKGDADSLRTQSSAQTAHIVATGRLWLSIILFVALVLSGIFSTVVTRAIVGPILKLTDVIRLIAAGKTDVSVPGLDRRDEIAVVAEATKLCRDSIIIAAQAAEREKAASMRLNAAINNLPQGLALFDSDRKIVFCNDRFAAMYGLSLDQVKPGTLVSEIFEARIRNGMFGGPSGDSYFRDRMRALGESSVRIDELSDGRAILITNEPMPEGGWVTTHEDITNRQRADAKIVFMAHHDLLTGLANRASFSEKLEDATARLRRHGDSFSVFMLDLDNFKTINDTLGHPAGDSLLKQVAQRLRSSLRETDVLARLGGDEFAIIQESGDNPQENAATLAVRIVEMISPPYEIDSTMVSVSASIGIALAPGDTYDSSNLLKMADLALYRAKSEGKNCHSFFEPSMLADADNRNRMEAELRTAISNGEFELYYQAEIDVKTRRPAAFEALVRWCHPTRGLVSPKDFIALAEETGLIVQIGEWVLQQACAHASQWPAHLKVAVNLSPVQLREPNLLDVILCALVESGLDPKRLELEITETALLEDDINHIGLIRKLKKLGVSIALDDFGTGYSSLSYLTMFPFDKIKIDRSFTGNLTHRSDCAAIVSAVIALGHGIDATTVAEGVETEQQCGILFASGVRFVQGFLFGQPCPASALRFDDNQPPAAVEDAA